MTGLLLYSIVSVMCFRTAYVLFMRSWASAAHISETPGNIAPRTYRRYLLLKLCSLAMVVLPVAPYAIVAFQTVMYARTLEGPIHASLAADGDNSHILMMKVLSANATSVSVYVVTPCVGLTPTASGKTAWTISLARTGPKWGCASMDVVWSDCGSARENVFPPYLPW